MVRPLVGGKQHGELPPGTATEHFRHGIIEYTGGARGFVSAVSDPIASAASAGAPVLVAVRGELTGPLREELSGYAEMVEIIDISEIARNPATIVPIWREFLDSTARGTARALGIAEPAWAGGGPAELD